MLEGLLEEACRRRQSVSEAIIWHTSAPPICKFSQKNSSESPFHVMSLSLHTITISRMTWKRRPALSVKRAPLAIRYRRLIGEWLPHRRDYALELDRMACIDDPTLQEGNTALVG
jgi:hypothetical protein